MFAAVMEDKEICREFLRLVLETDIGEVTVRTERMIGVNRRYRSVRLDVFVEDDRGRMYDLEMQAQRRKNLMKRSRYYQSQMDAADLKPRGAFEKLRKSYVIFICLFDPFGRGRYRYTFEECCLEESFPLGDETRKIFLSTEGENPEEVPPELVRFLKYVKDVFVLESEEADPFIAQVDSRVWNLKNNSGLEAEYMLFGELLDEQREEGKAEGKAEGRQELSFLVDALIKDGRSEFLPRLKEPEFLERMLKKYNC